MSKGRVFRPKGKNFLMVCYMAPGKDGGKRREVRESAGTLDEKAARSLLDRRLRGVANRREGIDDSSGIAQRVTVDDLLDALLKDYELKRIKSLDRVFHLIKRARGPKKPGILRASFGHMKAKEVSANTVREFIEKEQAKGKAPATINRYTETLNRAFQLAVEEKRLPDAFAPKISSLPENNARQGFFEKAEIDRLLPLLPAPLDDMVRLAYACAWRRDELRLLRWENVDRATREIRLATSKNGKPRSLPLDGEDWELIERLWTARTAGEVISGFVFHRNGKPINRTVFGKQFRRACVKAGLGHRDEQGHYHGKLFHDLRRSGVRDMIRSGVSQHVAMEISGHETPSMFQRYNITSADDKLEAMARRRQYVESRTESATTVVPIRTLIRTQSS